MKIPGRIFTTFATLQKMHHRVTFSRFSFSSFSFLGSYLAQRPNVPAKKRVLANVENLGPKKAFRSNFEAASYRFSSCKSNRENVAWRAREKRRKLGVERWIIQFIGRTTIRRRRYSGRLCEQIRVTLLGFLFFSRSITLEFSLELQPVLPVSRRYFY